MNNLDPFNKNQDYWNNWDDLEIWERINIALEKSRRRKFIFIFFIGIGLTIFFFKISYHFGNGVPIGKIENSVSTSEDNQDKSFFKTSTSNLNNFKNNKTIPGLFSNQIGEKEQKTNNTLRNSLKILRKWEPVDSNQFFNPDDPNAQANLEFKSDFIEPAKLEIFFVPYLKGNFLSTLNYCTRIKVSEKDTLLNLVFNKVNFEKSNVFMAIEESDGKKKGFSMTNKFGVLSATGVGIGKVKNSYNKLSSLDSLRATNERYLYSLNFGISLSFKYLRQFCVKLGMEWQKDVSSLTGSNINIQNYQIFYDSARVQEINGVKNYYSGYINEQRTTTEKYNVYNSYNYLHIPVGIGYDFRLRREQFNFGIETKFRITGSFKGFQYDLDKKIKSSSIMAARIDFNKLEFSDILLRLSYKRNISSNLELVSNFCTQFSLRPSVSIESTDPVGFKKSGRHYFINVGLNYLVH